MQGMQMQIIPWRSLLQNGLDQPYYWTSFSVAFACFSTRAAIIMLIS
jgi:hypothetical protein